LQELRAAIDVYSAAHAGGYHFLLTIASPAGLNNVERMCVNRLVEVVDWFNLMAYDYSGRWSTVANHQANFFPTAEAGQMSTSEAVRTYLDKGVPAGKIVLGMPVYGRSFGDTEAPGPGSMERWEGGVARLGCMLIRRCQC
jgi:chitinase